LVEREKIKVKIEKEICVPVFLEHFQHYNYSLFTKKISIFLFNKKCINV